jgi:hypothetical protein
MTFQNDPPTNLQSPTTLADPNAKPNPLLVMAAKVMKEIIFSSLDTTNSISEKVNRLKFDLLTAPEPAEIEKLNIIRSENQGDFAGELDAQISALIVLEKRLKAISGALANLI